MSFLKKLIPSAKPAAKPAAKSAAKAPKVKSGTKQTRGWFGGVGGASNLDKWYGECRGPCGEIGSQLQAQRALICVGSSTSNALV